MKMKEANLVYNLVFTEDIYFPVSLWTTAQFKRFPLCTYWSFSPY